MSYTDLECLSDNIDENYKTKMSGELKNFLHKFSSNLSILSFFTCFITLIILLVLLIINSFFSYIDIFYNIVQYIAIVIFFVIMLSYYILYKNTKKQN